MKDPQAALANAEKEIARIDAEIRELERQRTHHAEDARKAQLLVNGIVACRQCGRLVPEPCHDFATFTETGPWDGSCREAFHPSEYA